MNPEDLNFESPQNNYSETPPQEKGDATYTKQPEIEKETTSKTFELAIEYVKKENEALSEIPPECASCYRIATSFAGFTLELEKE
ncbi:MAG: hypothetical protein KAS07_02575 [Candidatus Pacebacteria bacterium]|nr:hypothetical protein [Candidatus Paceibacterota bacterium]